HNLLSIGKSNADYCFGSLRKQLPVATGGFCTSKYGDFTPHVPETALATELAMDKLVAMWLKSKYLSGTLEDKRLYRSISVGAEGQFGSHQTNSILPNIISEQLRGIDTEGLIVQTQSNVI